MPDLEDEDLFVEPNEPEQEAPEPDADGEDDEPIEIVLEGEDEPPAASAGADSDLIRRLRAELRDAKASARAEAPKPREIGPKPKLDDCYGADDPEAEFESRILKWNEAKREVDAAAEKQRKAQEASQKAWAEELQGFERKKVALKVPDFDVAEAAAVATLSQVQQAIIIQGARDSAKVIYALGKRPQKLAEIAAEQNPVKFARLIFELEGAIKVTAGRQRPPEPDTPLRGSATASSRNEDKVLAKLEAEADRTGDRSKIFAYRKQQKLAADQRRANGGRR